MSYTIPRCRNPLGWVLGFAALASLMLPAISTAGEPAEDFLKRLRAAGYYDTAIAYLARIDQYPGVDPKLIEAIPLEKAQTYIDAAVEARNAAARDENFVAAEKELMEFLKRTSHPRLSEARLQLGKLQMVRGAQLMAGKVDDSKRTLARESYLAAAKTFDGIVDELREKLKEMQGQKIDADKEPEKADLRDSYRAEFLQGQLNSGESRRLAASTFPDPAKDGKQLLEEALERFTDLSEKYSGYVQGAISMLYRGQVYQDLGDRAKATDSYIRMLEAPDADPLRDSKFQATTGLIQLYMTESPPKIDQAIERGQAVLDSARPNEKRTQTVQLLSVELAKAYMARVANKENQKPADIKRAETNGRQLLIAATKIPGTHVEEAEKLLASMGINRDSAEAEALPTADDPANFDEGLDAGRQLFEAAETLQKSLAVLESQPASPETATQITELQKQLTETRAIAIIVLGRSLAKINAESDVEAINQARQLYAYLLYQNKRYREAAVVGSFLARHSPGNEGGLRGGLIGLTSLQTLLADTPDEESGGVVSQIRTLGDYLTSTWPNDPQAAAAKGIMVRLALSKDRWDEAKQLIEEMPGGNEKASFQRLLGQLLWNESVQLRQNGSEPEAVAKLAEAEKTLTAGLTGLGKLVDPEALQAALVLAKVYMRQDNQQKAIDVLDNATYGPIKLVDQQGAPNDTFKSDLYATELQAVVGRMTSDSGDPEKLLERALGAMEKLRDSVTGDDKQKRLVAIYLGMARGIRDQLDTADPERKTKLINAFRVFLARIAETSNDPDTLQWVGQTLVQMGESSMSPGENVAKGQAAELITSAVETFESLKKSSQDLPPTVNFQLGRAYRMLGRYKDSIDTLEVILRDKPMMLDAQTEAALAYELWAGEIKPEFASAAYKSALTGARPNANHPKKENIIWGWGKISQLTSRDPKFRDMFFDARYHVAKCRFMMGVAAKNDATINQAVGDITQVAALYPDLGGPAQRQKFDALMKDIQKRLGQQPVGLPAAP